MAEVWLRFYEELNDFLPAPSRKVGLRLALAEGTSVKHLIEAQGVPHAEVDLILVNGRSVDFRYAVRDGDRISVYPVFEALDITPLVRLRPRPLRSTRFVLDAHLGRLARYLRMLGFDTLYRNDHHDAQIAALASAHRGRILLTRDRALLQRAVVARGLYVRATEPRRQLEEVVSRLDLYRAIRPFRRCVCCNARLARVDKAAVLHRLKSKTRQYFTRFWHCSGCGRLYWEGSHYQRMRRLVARLQCASPSANPPPRERPGDGQGPP